MKTRRLSLVLMLVLLTALLVVVPVQAGRTVTQVQFWPVDDPSWTGELPYRETGAVGHYVWSLEGPVEGSDPRVEGNLSWTMQGPTVWPNPHPCAPDAYWGPLDGTWRLVTPEGGWEGTCRVPVWCDPVKWPDSPMTARGNGFGAYKNMHIEWTMQFPSWEFSCQIK